MLTKNGIFIARFSVLTLSYWPQVRDLADFSYNKIDSGGKASGFSDGVLFSTYSSLVASSKKRADGKQTSRFDQITRWFGRGAGRAGKPRDFDGVVRGTAFFLLFSILFCSRTISAF